MEQLELFSNYDKVEAQEGGFDISKISIKYKGGDINSKEGNRLIKKLNKIDIDTFFIYPKGHPKLSCMPYVKNVKKNEVLSIGPNRNQYPAVSPGGVTIAIHKLVSLCFHKNSKPGSQIIVDHINENNEDIIYKIYEAFNWNPLDISAGWQYLDWRPVNLRWSNESNNRKNPQRKKESKLDLTHLFFRTNFKSI